MNRAPGYDAVIFDLDGVLVDSEVWWDEVRADFAAVNGRSWSADDRAAVMGANSATWARVMRERLSIDLPVESIERAVVDAMVDRYRREGAPEIEGAVEAVRRVAQSVPVAVASSAHPRVIETALNGIGLAGAFAAVASSDEVALGKPAPDVYLEVARQLGVAPERCLVVEDSLNGVRSARAAGMTVVLVPNRRIPPADGARQLAHVTLDRLADLDLGALAVGFSAMPGTHPAPDGSVTPPAESEAHRPAARVRAPGPRIVASRLPAADVPAWRRTLRYYVSRLVVMVVARAYLRIRVENRERLPNGPAVYCFNHLNWMDPFILMAALPLRPRLFFFGPKEEDMRAGGRNRLISWTGSAVPYKPGKKDLLGATRRVEAVFASGGVLAIAGEGRIHLGEAKILPLSDGPAYFALRAGVPLIPLAVNGTTWLGFGRRVRLQVGEPLASLERATSAAVTALTTRVWTALGDLVADAPEPPPPGRVGRWLTERFNDWPEGARPEPPRRT